MKLFRVRAAIIAAALASAACASSAQMATVPDESASALVGKWLWYPVAPWPIHDAVELHITAVDGSGSGTGTLRSQLVSEGPVRIRVRQDGAAFVVSIRVGWAIAFDLQSVILRVKTGDTLEIVTALAGSVSGYPGLPGLAPKQATFFKLPTPQ